MTPAQLATLKTSIGSNPAIANLPNDSDSNQAIANLYNAIATPAFYIWKASLPIMDVVASGLDWTEVDNLTPGKARIWEWMSKQNTINPSVKNVRDGLNAAFGSSPKTAALYPSLLYRPARVIERLLAAGGTGTTANPSTSTLEGDYALTIDDVSTARNV